MNLKNVFLLISLLSTPAAAFDITVAVPPGGGTGRTAVAISDSLKENSITSDVKYNQNCAIVKSQIESGQPMVYLNSPVGLSDPTCHIDIDGKKIKVLDELYYLTYGLCYRSDRKELGWDNFTDKKVKKNIAATIVTAPLLTKIISKMGLSDSVNIVPIGNSGKTREVILGSEFDYTIVDSPWIFKNTDKVNCLFVDTDSDVNVNNTTYTSLQNIMNQKYNGAKFPTLQDVLVVIGVNLPSDEQAKVKVELALVRLSNAWKNFIQLGNYEVKPSDHKFDKITAALGEK
jgi:hypothetical protein